MHHRCAPTRHSALQWGLASESHRKHLCENRLLAEERWRACPVPACAGVRPAPRRGHDPLSLSAHQRCLTCPALGGARHARLSRVVDHWQVKKLFTDRFVHTASFDLDGEEYDFYDALTRYVEDQSIKAAQEDSPRSRALSFTMAMLQRRFASSVYAVRRSLERMRDKRRKILDDPRDYLRKQMEIPDDLDDLPEEEREDYIEQIENAAISFDPTLLKEEILQIGRLIEVDLPIKRISEHARREKSIRHGHVST